MIYLLINKLSESLDAAGIYRFLQIINQHEFRALLAALFSFFVVLALGPRTILWLRLKKIGDQGLTDADALRQHVNSKQNTPTMGGILIVGAMGLSILLFTDLTQFVVLAGALVLFCYAGIGAVDDWLKLTAATRGGSRQGLYAWEKLVFQLGIAALVGYFAYRDGGPGQPLSHVLNLPFQKTYAPGGQTVADGLYYLKLVPYVIMMVLMVTGMSNAVNITDGMDGLATGVSTAAAAGLMILALVAGQEEWARFLLVPHVPVAEELGVIAGSMAGACLGFLWWNCSPAQVFMGDTGALALGAMIGYIAMVIRQEFVVLLMCGVFLLEIGSVVLQVGFFKATGGKRIFRVAPIHHHFHLSGWTEQQVVARAWIVSVLLVLVGLASIKVR